MAKPELSLAQIYGFKNVMGYPDSDFKASAVRPVIDLEKRHTQKPRNPQETR